jgi:outer membrane protein W
MNSIRRTMVMVSGCALAMLLCLSSFCAAAPDTSASAGFNGGTATRTDGFGDFLKDRVEIGTRFTFFSLEDSSRGASDHFFGSIDRLDAVQNFWPVKLFVNYKMNTHWGFDLTWDQIQAKTITKLDSHTDGTIKTAGPVLSVFGRYPNSTPFTPYAGVGVTYLFAGFDDDPRWEHPDTNVAILDQTFSLDNTWGWVAYVGLSAQLAEHWAADMFVRHMGADVKGKHYVVTADGVGEDDTLKFPLSNDAFGIGVRYAF